MGAPMLAFINNLSVGEMLVILIVAILVFGRRLPEVAARGAIQVRKLRKGVDDFRRESGFDEEVRKARQMIEDPVRQALKELDEKDIKRPFVGQHPDAFEEPREVEAEVAPGDEAVDGSGEASTEQPLEKRAEDDAPQRS